MYLAILTQIEQKKQLYVMVRRIHLLETVYNFDWISKQEYEAEINNLTQKYSNLKSMMKGIPGFDISKFSKEFNIFEETKIVEIVCERTAEGSGSKVLLNRCRKMIWYCLWRLQRHLSRSTIYSHSTKINQLS